VALRRRLPTQTLGEDGRYRPVDRSTELRQVAEALDWRRSWPRAWRDAIALAEYWSVDSEDRSLVGWRRWCIDGDMLVSPYRCTRWPEPWLRADDGCDPSGPVRDAPGIHAYWVRDAAMSGREPVWGEVRGYGRYAAGPEGWRAEEVVIVRLFIAQYHAADAADALAARYGVPVEEVV